MRKKWTALLAGVLLISLMAVSGCGKKESADDYLGHLIEDAKENGGALTDVLEDGINDIKEKQDLVIDFPEELKEPYQAFLQEALKQVQFEINKPKKESEDVYQVRVTYAPIDIEAVTEAANTEFVKKISSVDLSVETENLLKKDVGLLESAGNQQKKSQVIQVSKSEGELSVDEEDIKTLLKDALQGYMVPYAAVANVFDMRDFMQAYLDASMKCETERYQQHVGFTEEEAVKWYEDSFAEFRIDDLSEEQNNRYINAMKTIYRNCQYSVGVVKQKTMTEFEIDITTTPNTSFLDAMNEFQSRTYYSQAAVNDSFVKDCENHASAPSYGEETTITITWNALNVFSNQLEDPEYLKMIETIIPTE